MASFPAMLIAVFGIAFEGCAGKAAFHTGVVDWMVSRGIRPAASAGASSGAIVAALIASRREAELHDAWMAAAGQAVFQPVRLLKGRWPFAMSDIVGGPVRALFGDTRMDQLPDPLAISVTHLGLHRPHRRLLGNQDPVRVADAVLASCFLPGPYSRHVAIQGRCTLDGAWGVRTPVDAAPLRGLKTIACVTNTGGRLITGFFRPAELTVESRCRVLKPVAPIPVSGFDLQPAGLKATVDLGRRSAEAFFRSNEGWLLAAE